MQNILPSANRWENDTNIKGFTARNPVYKLFKIRGTLSNKIKIKMKEFHALKRIKRWEFFQ